MVRVMILARTAVIAASFGAAFLLTGSSVQEASRIASTGAISYFLGTLSSKTISKSDHE
jgi:hypothetical protein